MIIYFIHYRRNHELDFAITTEDEPREIDTSFHEWAKTRAYGTVETAVFDEARVYCRHGNLCTKGKVYGIKRQSASNGHLFYYVVE